jgi:uncharacterized protein YndB with AHSA1/START domain
MSERPDVPLRAEFSVEVPGTPDQVWAALATGGGISSWFLRTEIDEREGGALLVHMGDDSSPGTVTGWDPPHRLAYAEPEWARLAGRPDSPVTPLVSEFLVEARSGGTCVVRVVSSAFGTGADWEGEFFDEMVKYWKPFFENHLRLYLGRFAGAHATTLEVAADLPGDGAAVRAAMARSLGVDAAGQPVEALGLTGTVEEIGDPYLIVDVSGPVPGYVGLVGMDGRDGGASAQIAAWLFGAGAEAFVEKAEPEWRAWLQELVVSKGNR